MDGQASKPTPGTPFNVGEWRVDPQLDEISRAGVIRKIEPRMIRMLCRLAESPGELVTTQELLDSVWPGVVVGPASVYQAVSQLRRLLGGRDATPNYIATVPRKGYRLMEPVEIPDPVPTLAPPAVPVPRARRRAGHRWMMTAAIVAMLLAVLLMY